MSYQAILEDPIQIASLSGQRFVVLRAPAAVAAPWSVLQQTLRRELTGAVFYPATAHLTLTGFVAGTSLDALVSVVRDWAEDTPPLRFDAEAIDTFPSPAQVVSVRVRKTPELVAALGTLRDRAAAAGLTVSSTIPLDDWVPRMSLVYAGRLDVSGWQTVLDATQSREWPVVGDEVAAVEVLAFDDGEERTGGAFTLTGVV
jgi:hypothetical protein